MGWILPIGGASAGEGLPCSLRSRLVYNVLNDSLVLLFLLVVLALVLVLVISSPLHFFFSFAFSPLLTYLPSSVTWWPHGGWSAWPCWVPLSCLSSGSFSCASWQVPKSSISLSNCSVLFSTSWRPVWKEFLVTACYACSVTTCSLTTWLAHGLGIFK